LLPLSDFYPCRSYAGRRALPKTDIALSHRVPNIPFFYLAYRAWSHWRALSGGKHINFLVQNNLLTLTPSPVLDEVYAHQNPLASTPEPTTGHEAEKLVGDEINSPNPDGETMLLSQEHGKKMTQALDLPQLEVELERAIWQVEGAVKKSNLNAEVAKKEAEDKEKKAQ